MTEDVSPAVKILESNYLSNSNIEPTQNIALFVGEFEKGNINEPKLISSALELKLLFGRATDSNFNDWYQVYNYLQYPGSPKIWVCRTSGTENINASNNGIIANSPGDWVNLLTIEIYHKNNYDSYLKDIFGFYSSLEVTEDYLVIIRRKDQIVENFIITDSIDLTSQYLQEINLVPGIYQLTGGYSESATIDNYKESFEIFTKENYEIDIVIAPEYYNEVVIDFVESRKDCIGFLGIPRQIIQYLMVNGLNLATEAGELIVLSIKNLVATKADYNIIVEYIESINKSQYCFMTYGFKSQVDGFTGKNRIINVNGDIAGLKAHNSAIVHWGIPSGVERGIIKNAEKFTMKISKAEADKLYKLGVNTISNGTLLTQKLFVQKEEICTRLHQRCIFNYVERVIEKLTRKYIFSENNRNIRGTIALQIKKILEDILSSGGITAGKVYVTSSSEDKIIINIYIKIPYITELVNIRMFNSGTSIGFINETI
jgi:hypothetical protein